MWHGKGLLLSAVSHANLCDAKKLVLEAIHAMSCLPLKDIFPPLSCLTLCCDTMRYLTDHGSDTMFSHGLSRRGDRSGWLRQ